MARVSGSVFLSVVAVLPTISVLSRAAADDGTVAAALAGMVAHPDDPDATFQYARIAASEGQPRAAIAALERILRMNPGLDNIRLELASLYLSTGSPDIATTYAREALKSPIIPPDVAERARGLLASAEKAASRSLLQVNLFSGFRWDSNATQATALSAIPIFVPQIGTTVAVNPGIKAQSDGS